MKHQKRAGEPLPAGMRGTQRDQNNLPTPIHLNHFGPRRRLTMRGDKPE